MVQVAKPKTLREIQEDEAKERLYTQIMEQQAQAIARQAQSEQARSANMAAWSPAKAAPVKLSFKEIEEEERKQRLEQAKLEQPSTSSFANIAKPTVSLPRSLALLVGF
jgi:hypothetical protein